MAMEDNMDTSLKFKREWLAVLREAAREVRNDLGNPNGDDLAYEIAITSNVLARHSDKNTGDLEEKYLEPCLWYLRRSYAIAQQAFDSRIDSFQPLWQHLALAYKCIALNHSTPAIFELDKATLDVVALTGKTFGPYASLNTVQFLIGKFKERLSLKRPLESARNFELDGILSGATISCRELGLDFRGLGAELTPLYEVLYEGSIPELDEVEALERALVQPTIN
jgi:hypothetical protein